MKVQKSNAMNNFFLLIVKPQIVFFLFLLSFFFGFAQDKPTAEIQSTKIDSLYREDQFYIGVTYNLLKNVPVGFSNDKFSTGFSAGFLRDMPINKNRNLAIAPGLGLTFNNYSQNIGITTTNATPVYVVLTDVTSYSNNKFSQLFVDVPLEFRWRGSTFENHNFFRIYGGVKLSYLIYNRSLLRSGKGDSIIVNNPDINKLVYGAYFAAGYGGANLYIYYGLNSIFKTAQIAGTKVDMKSLNIGLIFYIL
jgi:hypothetical protein